MFPPMTQDRRGPSFSLYYLYRALGEREERERGRGREGGREKKRGGGLGIRPSKYSTNWIDHAQSTAAARSTSLPPLNWHKVASRESPMFVLDTYNAANFHPGGCCFELAFPSSDTLGVRRTRGTVSQVHTLIKISLIMY